MSEDTPEEAIERGLEAYFAGDALTDLLDGIDVEGLAEGAALDDAVEYERLGRVLGALIGRAAARGIANSGLLGRIVKESVGSELGGRAGEAAAVALVEHVDLDALAERARGATDPERLDSLAADVDTALTDSGLGAFAAGTPTDADWTDIDVESEGEPTDE